MAKSEIAENNTLKYAAQVFGVFFASHAAYYAGTEILCPAQYPVPFNCFLATLISAPLVLFSRLAALVYQLVALVLPLESFEQSTALFGALFAISFLAWITSREAKAPKNPKNDVNIEITTPLNQHHKALVVRAASIVNEANQLLATLPRELASAENSISSAHRSFTARSFYPFWDYVGEAVQHIYRYKECARLLEAKRIEYYRLLIKAKSDDTTSTIRLPGPFPASMASANALQIGIQTSKRLQYLIDRAHRDFEFANIYANWRTNRTLVSGFENLMAGLSAINDELSNIDFTLNSGLSSISSNLSRLNSSVVSSLEQQTEIIGQKLSTTHVAQSENEREMIDLLDNIQRGRERIPGLNDYMKMIYTRPQR